MDLLGGVRHEAPLHVFEIFLRRVWTSEKVSALALPVWGSRQSLNALEEDPVEGFLLFCSLADPAQVSTHLSQEIDLTPNLDDKILGDAPASAYNCALGRRKSPKRCSLFILACLSHKVKWWHVQELAVARAALRHTVCMHVRLYRQT